MSDLQKSGVFLVAENAHVFFGDMKQAASAVDAFGDTTDKTGGRVNGFDEILVGVFRRAGEAIFNFAAEGGKALIGFVSDSVGVAGDFEAGMNRFKSAVGDGLDTKGLAEFHDLFIQIGKDLPVSTSDVQDAAIALVKGGLDPAILSAGGLKNSIQFAAAAEMDLAAAAELGVKQLGVWTSATATADEQTKFLAMSQDLLVKAAGASTLDVDNLAASMNIAGGQARALNLDYRDFATGITLISPAFNSAQEAGTSYKNFLARLQPSTDPATAAMQELGLWTEETGSAFFNAQGQFVGNAQAAELLQQATAGLTDAKKAELLQTIFGNDAMGAAVALAQSGAEGYDILSQKIDHAAGVQDTAAAKQAGYNTAMQNFQGSVEALQITLGEKLLPVLTDLFNNVFAPAVNTISTLTDAVSGNDEAFNSLSPTMQTVATYIQDFFADVEQGIAVAEEIIGSFQSVSQEGSELGAFITDLGAIWNAYYKTVESNINAALGLVQSVFGVIRTFLNQNGDEVEGDLKETWDSVYTIVMTALELVRMVISTTFGLIKGLIDTHGEEIQRILKDTWTIISNVIGIVLDTIKGVVTAALAIMKGDWQGAWDAVRTMTESVTKRLWEIIKALLDEVLTLFGTSLDDVVKTISDGFNDAVRAIERFGRDVYNAGAAFIDNLWTGMRVKWDEFKRWLEAQWQSVKDMLPGSEPKDTSSPLYGLGDSGAAFIENILTGMQQALPSLMQFVTDMGQDLVGTLEDVNDQIASLMADAYGGQANMFRTQAQNIEGLATAQAELDPRALMGLQSRLNDALTESQQITDPQAAAEYYDMLSRQAFEFANLQQQYFEALDASDTARLLSLSEQMRLIDQAQAAERAQFRERQQAEDNPFLQLHDDIQALLSSMTFDGAYPPEAMALFALLTQLAELGMGQVTPPATPQQIYGGMAGGTSNSYGPTYNLGVTTNQSPQVVLQGFWLLQAGAI